MSFDEKLISERNSVTLNIQDPVYPMMFKCGPLTELDVLVISDPDIIGDEEISNKMTEYTEKIRKDLKELDYIYDVGDIVSVSYETWD